MEIISWKVTVNFFAMKAADKRDRAVFKNQAEAVFTQPDAVILAGSLKPFEIGNLLKRPRGLNLLDDFTDAAQQRRVGDDGQIGIKGFAEGGLHAARARRWKILARLTVRDFSPDWMARSMAASSRLSCTAARKMSCRSSRTSVSASLSSVFRRRSSIAVMQTS